MLLAVARLAVKFALQATVGDWAEEIGVVPAKFSRVMESLKDEGVSQAHLGFAQVCERHRTLSNAEVGNVDTTQVDSTTQSP